MLHRAPSDPAAERLSSPGRRRLLVFPVLQQLTQANKSAPSECGTIPAGGSSAWPRQRCHSSLAAKSVVSAAPLAVSPQTMEFNFSAVLSLSTASSPWPSSSPHMTHKANRLRQRGREWGQVFFCCLFVFSISKVQETKTQKLLARTETHS